MFVTLYLRFIFNIRTKSSCGLWTFIILLKIKIYLLQVMPPLPFLLSLETCSLLYDNVVFNAPFLYIYIYIFLLLLPFCSKITCPYDWEKAEGHRRYQWAGVLPKRLLSVLRLITLAFFTVSCDIAHQKVLYTMRFSCDKC